MLQTWHPSRAFQLGIQLGHSTASPITFSIACGSLPGHPVSAPSHGIIASGANLGGAAERVMVRLKVLLGLLAVAAAAAAAALAQQPVQPQPQVGSCPLGYYSSGGYCLPSANGNTRGAIEMTGNSCSLGFYASGNDCVSSTSSKREAISKIGQSCPLGWFSSGSYCLKSR